MSWNQQISVNFTRGHKPPTTHPEPTSHWVSHSTTHKSHTPLFSGKCCCYNFS